MAFNAPFKSPFVISSLKSATTTASLRLRLFELMVIFLTARCMNVTRKNIKFYIYLTSFTKSPKCRALKRMGDQGYGNPIMMNAHNRQADAINGNGTLGYYQMTKTSGK